MDNLLGITSFVRTAELSSFAAAARSLGLTPSAVGKNVAKLEASLNVRLLHRTTRRVGLTTDGLLFFQRCQRILDDLKDAEAAVSDSGAAPRGRLRLSLPMVGYRFLMPHLPAFRSFYPDIELDLHFNDRIVDLIAEGMDAAIRSGQLKDSGIVARKIRTFGFMLCASPIYAEAFGLPRASAELPAHSAIRFRYPGSEQLQEWPIEKKYYPKTVIACSNMEGVRAAALQGLGLAYMPDFMAADAIREGLLQTVLDRELRSTGQFSVVWPTNRLVSPRLRAFIDFAATNLFRAVEVA